MGQGGARPERRTYTYPAAGERERKQEPKGQQDSPVQQVVAARDQAVASERLVRVRVGREGEQRGVPGAAGADAAAAAADAAVGAVGAEIAKTIFGAQATIVTPAVSGVPLARVRAGVAALGE